MSTRITREQVLACTDLARDYPWLAAWHAQYRAEADRLLCEVQARKDMGRYTESYADAIGRAIGAVYSTMRAIERQAVQIGGPTLRSRDLARITQLEAEVARLTERLAFYEGRKAA